MIEENGHRWEAEGEYRCVHCQLKRRQYLEFKAAYQEAEKEGDVERMESLIKMGLYCPGRATPPDLPKPPKLGLRPDHIAVLQLDFWDEETKKWTMFLDYKFNDAAMAYRIQEVVGRMMAEAGIKDRRET